MQFTSPIYAISLTLEENPNNQSSKSSSCRESRSDWPLKYGEVGLQKITKPLFFCRGKSRSHICFPPLCWWFPQFVQTYILHRTPTSAENPCFSLLQMLPKLGVGEKNSWKMNIFSSRPSSTTKVMADSIENGENTPTIVPFTVQELINYNSIIPSLPAPLLLCISQLPGHAMCIHWLS